MSKLFIISDTHFSHKNILNFTDDQGYYIRPGFTSVEHMNEVMIENWNSVVGAEDKVYHLGDVVMSTSAKKMDEIMSRLNGTKVLIKGNHDRARLNIYQRYFKDVRSEVYLKMQDGRRVHLSHFPIHPISIHENFNVHGHIHEKVIEDDSRYLNLSVERWNYRPVEWGEVTKVLQANSLGDLVYGDSFV